MKKTHLQNINEKRSDFVYTRQRERHNISDTIIPIGPIKDEEEYPAVSCIISRKVMRHIEKKAKKHDVNRFAWIEACVACMLGKYNCMQNARYNRLFIHNTEIVQVSRDIDTDSYSFVDIARQLYDCIDYTILSENEINIGSDVCLWIQDESMKKISSNTDELFVMEDNVGITNGLYIMLYLVEKDYYLLVKSVSRKYGMADVKGMLEKLNNIILDSINQKYEFLISKNDREIILKKFNKTEIHIQQKRTIIDLFNECVIKYPEAVAIRTGSKEISYSTLNEHVNQLYYFLKQNRIGKGDIVSVICERSVEFFVAVLGVMKTGAAYLPIDPNNSTDRIQFILENSNSKIVLYQSAVKISKFNIPMYNLNDRKLFIKKNKVNKKISDCCPKDVAYCIYTSGTTGVPKGVLVSHAALFNFIIYSKRELTIQDKKIIAPLFTNHCFDLSIPSIFLPICFCGMVDIIERAKEHDVAAILETGKYTFMKMTPSHLKIISGTEKVCLSQKCAIVVGGERLEQETVDYIYNRYGNEVHIFNEYGPTEATVGTTIYDTQIGSIYKGVHIGKPIANAKVYILSKQQKLCGVGEVGEICIGGIGVANGYIERGKGVQTTEQKFVHNPFDKGMMYMSGDYAMYLPDGNIKYIGRIDRQVKINGYRIDLCEINACIKSINKEITDCTVQAIETGDGETELCVYYVSDYIISRSEFRKLLCKKLPNYMIPMYYVKLDEMPMNENGKLDFKALPDVLSMKQENVNTESYISLGNDNETKVKIAFSGVLGIPISMIELDSSFFELGGNSFQANRLTHCMEEMFGVHMSINQIFELKSPRRIASELNDLDDITCTVSKIKRLRNSKKTECYPATAAQSRMYFLQKRDGGTVYNLPKLLVINGKIDSKRMKTAIQAVVDKHEILRTSFVFKGDKLEQYIAEEVEVDYCYITGVGRIDENYIKKLVKPFDLEKPSQLRIRLFEQKKRYLLFIDMHHIISDGMSLQLFSSELSAAYNGTINTFSDFQFKDYSEWIREYDITSQKKFWLSELEGYSGMVNIPTDFSRKKKQSKRGKHIEYCIDENNMNKLRAFTQNHVVTDYMVFLSAMFILIKLHSGENDVAVGSVVSGRTNPITESLLGLFVNTIVVRDMVRDDGKYLSFLKSIKEKCLNIYNNQDYPFDELVHKVIGTSDSIDTELFNVVIVVQNNEKPKYRFDDCVIEYQEINTENIMFDLEFIIENKENGLYCIRLNYNCDLFKQETAEVLLEHYSNIVKYIINSTNEQTLIADIQYMNDLETKKIFCDFNKTDFQYDKDKTLVDIFESIVELYPDKTAIVYENTKMTYAELNCRANQIATILRREYNVCPNDFVAMSFKRGIEMISTIIGIIKAGGAYVPIDPTYPRTRVEYIISDCAPKVLVCQCEDVILEQVAIRQITYDQIGEEQNVSNLPHVNKADDLAYAIYTSGTTGQPKGVLIEHQMVNNLRNAFKAVYKVEGNDVFLQFAQYIFDASVWEWVGALLFGATLCIAPKDKINDAQDMAEYVRKNGVTQALFPPQYQHEVGLGGLKVITTGGTASSSQLVKKCLINNINYINAYGPTECTVTATYWSCDDSNFSDDFVPIGKPQPNVQTYIMNDDKLCGIGISGELCLGGDSLARGYLNNDELTAEKFVWSSVINKRIYRTGDLARWLPDGNIMYMGRVDSQVKINGYRIELGEIENTTLQIPDITDAVAILRSDEKLNQSRIILYFTSYKILNDSYVLDFLSNKLPKYMIPTGILQLDSIPVGRTGKVDVSKLPDVKMENYTQYVEPQNDVEKIVASLFEEILHVEHIGAKGNFFDNGGRSLDITRLLNVLRSKFEVKITYRDIYANQTVEKLADLIQLRQSEKV